MRFTNLVEHVANIDDFSKTIPEGTRNQFLLFMKRVESIFGRGPGKIWMAKLFRIAASDDQKYLTAFNREREKLGKNPIVKQEAFNINEKMLLEFAKFSDFFNKKKNAGQPLIAKYDFLGATPEEALTYFRETFKPTKNAKWSADNLDQLFSFREYGHTESRRENWSEFWFEISNIQGDLFKALLCLNHKEKRFTLRHPQRLCMSHYKAIEFYQIMIIHYKLTKMKFVPPHEIYSNPNNKNFYSSSGAKFYARLSPEKSNEIEKLSLDNK